MSIRTVPLVAALLLATSVAAQESVSIQFESGTSGATINGSIIGDEYIDYVLRANGGQLMIATLEVTDTNGNGSANFNILPAGADFPALYNSANTGEMSGSIVLPEGGDWAIRVYLMGNDRDTDKTVGYTLYVSIQ